MKEMMIVFTTEGIKEVARERAAIRRHIFGVNE